MTFTEEQLQSYKTEYISLLQSTNRQGIENVIDWLSNKSDFFSAPSSTIYHNSCQGGLLAHSLNVYKAAQRIYDSLKDMSLPEKHLDSISQESILISTLLHDICKCNFYKPTTKMYKDDYGSWHRYATYTIDDHSFPMGHGEKSVIMLLTLGLKLYGHEQCAIRWHMGLSDPGMYLSPYCKNAMMSAINDVPLVEIVMLADHYASFMMEHEVDQKLENEVPMN